MDDGTYSNGVLKLCTDNFTYHPWWLKSHRCRGGEQVQFLCNMLFNKYGIVCHPQRRTDTKWRLYIAAREMHKVRALVTPYLIPSMMYKVGL